MSLQDDAQKVVRAIARVTAVAQALRHYSEVLEAIDIELSEPEYITTCVMSSAYRDAASSIEAALADESPLVLQPDFAHLFEKHED